MHSIDFDLWNWFKEIRRRFEGDTRTHTRTYCSIETIVRYSIIFFRENYSLCIHPNLFAYSMEWCLLWNGDSHIFYAAEFDPERFCVVLISWALLQFHNINSKGWWIDLALLFSSSLLLLLLKRAHRELVKIQQKWMSINENRHWMHMNTSLWMCCFVMRFLFSFCTIFLQWILLGISVLPSIWIFSYLVW